MTVVMLGASVLLWLGAYGQRRIADRRLREAFAVYDQAEALVRLAIRYREDGDQAHDDARRAIGDARARMEEWVSMSKPVIAVATLRGWIEEYCADPRLPLWSARSALNDLAVLLDEHCPPASRLCERVKEWTR